MTKHKKRYEAPTKRWGIPTKEDFWSPKTSAGPHPSDSSVPLVIIIRDLLEYADSSRKANVLISEGEILVDGKKQKDKNLPIGLMDVVSIPELDEHYRLLFDQHNKVRLSPTAEDTENWKLVRIEEKTLLKDDEVQLNLHDGKNIRVDNGGKYSTKDVLKISLPELKIIESYEFGEGKMALITGGKHVGEIGKIKKYEKVRGSQPNMVHFEEDISTVKKYVFVIGEEKPEIKIPEVGII